MLLFEWRQALNTDKALKSQLGQQSFKELSSPTVSFPKLLYHPWIYAIVAPNLMPVRVESPYRELRVSACEYDDTITKFAAYGTSHLATTSSYRQSHGRSTLNRECGQTYTELALKSCSGLGEGAGGCPYVSVSLLDQCAQQPPDLQTTPGLRILAHYQPSSHPRQESHSHRSHTPASRRNQGSVSSGGF